MPIDQSVIRFKNDARINDQDEVRDRAMHIRELEEKDNQTIEGIIKRSLESLGLDIPGTAYFDPELGQLASFYSRTKDARYFVAVNEMDEILGGVGIAPFDVDKGICELQKLYVIPEAQGRGVAKELMRAALDFATDHYKYCYLETSTTLQAATALYVSLGFQSLKHPLGNSGHNAMDIWLIKTLNC